MPCRFVGAKVKNLSFFTRHKINHEATILPVVSIQSTNPATWLQAVQRALQSTSGVVAISGLHKEMDWREACILSDMLVKCYMVATQHHPLELHAAVDLEKGPTLSCSMLTFQKLKFFHPHVDRGLFNVVLGPRTAFRGLFILLPTEPHAFGATPCVYDRTSGEEDSLWAVVIPGLSLHWFEPQVPAPTHWVVHAGDSERDTQVFRCRLRPDVMVAGLQIVAALQQVIDKGVPAD